MTNFDRVSQRNFSAVQLCYIAKMLHLREVALCDGNSVRYDLTRPDRSDAMSACRKREHADPVKQTSERDRHVRFSPGVVVINLYSSVSLGMVLTKGTMEPPMRSRP